MTEEKSHAFDLRCHDIPAGGVGQIIIGIVPLPASMSAAPGATDGHGFKPTRLIAAKECAYSCSFVQWFVGKEPQFPVDSAPVLCAFFTEDTLGVGTSAPPAELGTAITVYVKNNTEAPLSFTGTLEGFLLHGSDQ